MISCMIMLGSLKQMAKVARMCLSHEVQRRPSMSIVVRALELCDTSEPLELVGLSTEAKPRRLAY